MKSRGERAVASRRLPCGERWTALLLLLRGPLEGPVDIRVWQGKKRGSCGQAARHHLGRRGDLLLLGGHVISAKGHLTWAFLLEPCCKGLCAADRVPLWEEAVGTFPGVGAENHPEATLIAGRTHWGILMLGSVVIENVRYSKADRSRALPLKRQFATHRSQEEEACHSPGGHLGKHQCGSAGREVGRAGAKSLYCGFPGKERVRQGKQA